MRTLRVGILLAAVIAAVVILGSAKGGIASAGKRSGVVVFDRWDGCTFYYGVGLDYIAEKEKELLRKYAGENVQIDAAEVSQPVNPGDALLSKITYLGPAPASASAVEEALFKTLTLRTSLAAKDGEPPVITMEIINSGKEDFKIDRLVLAPTLLTKFSKPEFRGFIPADGPSFAALTSQEVKLGDWSATGLDRRPAAKGFLWDTEGIMNAVPSKAHVRDDARLHQTLVIKPGQKLAVTIEMEVPPGEYDFLCGINGGIYYSKCVTSNLTAFDVAKDGKVKSVQVKGR